MTNEFHAWDIKRLPDDLTARFEVPDGRIITMKCYNKDNVFVETSYSHELINKINELVDAINELKGV